MLIWFVCTLHSLKFIAFWDTAPRSLIGKTDVSEVRTASIIRMDAAWSSETPVYFYETTQRNILEGRHLHTRRRDNMKTRLKSLNSKAD
jgi:hypothetical protein